MNPINVFGRLKSSKVFWLMAVGLVGVAQQYFMDAIGGQAAMGLVIGLLYAIFNRDAQAKGGKVGS